jgi:hypothetical protein
MRGKTDHKSVIVSTVNECHKNTPKAAGRRTDETAVTCAYLSLDISSSMSATSLFCSSKPSFSASSLLWDFFFPACPAIPKTFSRMDSR